MVDIRSYARQGVASSSSWSKPGRTSGDVSTGPAPSVDVDLPAASAFNRRFLVLLPTADYKSVDDSLLALHLAAFQEACGARLIDGKFFDETYNLAVRLLDTGAAGDLKAGTDAASWWGDWVNGTIDLVESYALIAAHHAAQSGGSGGGSGGSGGGSGGSGGGSGGGARADGVDVPTPPPSTEKGSVPMWLWGAAAVVALAVLSGK